MYAEAPAKDFQSKVIGLVFYRLLHSVHLQASSQVEIVPERCLLAFIGTPVILRTLGAVVWAQSDALGRLRVGVEAPRPWVDGWAASATRPPTSGQTKVQLGSLR